MTLSRSRLWITLLGVFNAIAIASSTVLAQVAKADQLTLESFANVLQTAASNRSEIERAISEVPIDQGAGMAHLLNNLTASDLQNLSAAFLLQNVELAYLARLEASWGKGLPEEVFLDNVLPFANINERRDDVRLELREKFWPVVRGVDSPAVAAARLNQAVFKELNVKYSTKRRRADQGPRESMETGLASCTGLSILLIDACRACGIPARFVGTPMWSDGSGNHSWVEVWDQDWHFTGAAEPTGDELDKAWFIDRASKASLTDPKHGIFAVCFSKTELSFPMVWAQSNQAVYAVDVTSRYAQPQKLFPKGLVEVQFRALTPAGFDRCQANLVVSDGKGNVVFRGQTNDERFDANDHLRVSLPQGEYSVELTTNAGVVRSTIQATEDGKLITLRAPEPSAAKSPIEQLEAFLESKVHTVFEVAAQEFSKLALSKAEAERAQLLLWKSYAENLRKERQAEVDAKLIKLGELEMPYELTTFGVRPDAGYSLVISMHGGGGAPKAVNDRQWENQKRLYKLEEGIYVTPRAPTDTWNLWHQEHIDPFFTRLIQDMILFEGVNPDRVYITGYSAGGDGVFQLAPRMADQLAAAAMMAGHPNETQPDGLRNLPFTLHMGANDSAYNRSAKALEWKTLLAKQKQADMAGYEHWVEIHEGKSHWMDGQDAAGVKWMSQFVRNIIPERIVWLQDDVLHPRFYWLAVSPEHARARSRIISKREKNRITLESSDADEVVVLLRDDMLDLDQPVEIYFQDQPLFQGQITRTIENLANSLLDRGDPQAMFSAHITVKVR